ncbi:hypothetical protein ACJRO7_016769 [Eucalyptus globulus]|uniref:RRM domain-containing protein n=1 Tax=Eucalyptus globulus TaxID=34317 RepID=A0ABD3KNS4_EUCGL
MWATPTQIPIPPSLSRATYGSTSSDKFRTKWSNLRVRASFFDYPLASRIMVRNIPYSLNESRLLKEFSTFGHVAEVKLAKDEATKQSRGYAFIQYTCQDDAVLALENMDRKKLEGRVIYVEIAKPGKEAYDKPWTCGPPPPPPPPPPHDDRAAE